MQRLLQPPSVKLVIAALHSDEEKIAAAEQELAVQFGQIDYASNSLTFEITAYYTMEMGSPIYRKFFGFHSLIAADALVEIKLKTAELESQLAVDGRRLVNLDPGYLDLDKFVLASFKARGNKIYLTNGVWADMTLHYEKGHFLPFPWSFPDFQTRQYERDFLRLRALYKTQLRSSIDSK